MFAVEIEYVAASKRTTTTTTTTELVGMCGNEPSEFIYRNCVTIEK